MIIPQRSVWRASFSRDEQALLCLTSLQHRRFIDDAIQIMGLPLGAILRLRYRKNYVASSLWERVRSEDEAPKLRALIVLGGSSAEKGVYRQPLRVGKVLKITSEGELLSIDIRLEGFAPDPNKLGVVWNEISLLARNLPTDHHTVTGSAGHYVQVLSHVPESVLVSPSVDYWEIAAAGFFKVDAVTRGARLKPCVPYLFMTDGLERAGRMSKIDDQGRLVAESGSTIRWQVHTIVHPESKTIRDPIGEVLFDISNPASSALSSKRVRIDSKRDVKEVMVSIQSQFRPSLGHISIRAVIFDGEPLSCDLDQADRWVARDQRREITLSRFDLPFRAGRWLPTVAAFLAAIAAGLAVLDSDALGTAVSEKAIALVVFALVFFSIRMGFSKSS